jgi:cell division protein FtsQ
VKISDNKLISKRRRKRTFRRWILFMIFILSVTIAICLKLKVFNIKSIVVKGQNFVSEEEIVKLSNIQKDTNIFYTNSKICETNIKTNPYILDVKINKKLPSTIEIEIQERTARFYSSSVNNINYVIDDKGIILQKVEKVDTSKLIKLEGFDLTNAKPGEALPGSDNRTLKALQAIYLLTNNKINNHQINDVDLTDLLNIKIYYGNMLVKVGDYDNLTKKLNEALNIMDIEELKGAKGYIDVSFNNNPVVFVEK